MNSFQANGMGHTSFRADGALTDDQIRRVAPSVFAMEPHSSRSERYTYIPTCDVLRNLRNEGFQPVAVMQGRSRLPGKAEFTKHLLRLRHQSTSITNVGEEFPEIVLINSHDGTASYNMMGGMFRVACLNGLVVCKELFEEVRIKHAGDIAHDVVQGAYQVLDGFDLIKDVTAQMKNLRLSAPEQTVFAEAALTIKYGESDEGEAPEAAPITAAQLLRARRYGDDAPDLWTTFNRVQENVIKGGVPGRNANNRRVRTREVTAIDTNVKLNRALWTLAARMAELKQG